MALVLSGSATGRGFGVNAGSVEALDQALSGIKLDHIRLRLETAPFDGRAVAQNLLELVARRGDETAKLRIDFGLDPVSDMARCGGMPMSWPELAERFTGTARLIAEKGVAGRAARVDGRVAHEAGASEAQELAFVLATGVAYLRAFETQGWSLDQARKALGFLLVADADEIHEHRQVPRPASTLGARRRGMRARARADRTLGGDGMAHGDAARPLRNMLRATLAAFSAGVAGADSIGVLPFTAALGLPDAFRTARGAAISSMCSSRNRIYGASPTPPRARALSRR